MRKISLFLVGMMMLFQACDVALSPKDYESEIEDAAKFYIAEANLLVNLADEGKELAIDLLGKDGGVEDKILELCEKPDYSFRRAVSEVSQWKGTFGKTTFANIAKRWLKLYDETEIILTEYELIKSTSQKKIWQFKELNSDIDFTFTFEIENDNRKYTIAPLENSFVKYLDSKID